MNVDESEVVVIFKDGTGRYLYEEINPLYNKDSLKVNDEFGNRLSLLSQLNLIPGTSSKYYEVSFGNIYDNTKDQAAFNTELCKKFIIRYRYNEIDTVQTCFKAKKTKCGSVFEYLKVYHKGQLLTTENNTTTGHITLIKP